MNITLWGAVATIVFLVVGGSNNHSVVAAACEPSSFRFSTKDIRRHNLQADAFMSRPNEDEQAIGFSILDATLLTGGQWIVARLVTNRQRRPDEVASGYSLRPTPEAISCERLIAVSLETDERVMLSLVNDAHEAHGFRSPRAPKIEFDRVIPSAHGDSCLFVLTHQKEHQRSRNVFEWDVARRSVSGLAVDSSVVAVWTGLRTNTCGVSTVPHDNDEMVSVRISGRRDAATFAIRPGYFSIVREVHAPGERVVTAGGDGKSVVVTKDFGASMAGDILVRCYDVESECGVRWELNQSDFGEEEVIQVLPLGCIVADGAYCLCVVHPSSERGSDGKYVIVYVDNGTGAVLNRHALPIFSLWTNPVLCAKRRAIVCAAGTPQESDAIAVVSVDSGDVTYVLREDAQRFEWPIGCSPDGRLIVNNGSAIFLLDDSARGNSKYEVEMLFELVKHDGE